MAAPLIVVHVALLSVYDLGRHPGLTLALLGAAFASHAWAVRRLELDVSPASVLVIAAVLRILLLPLPPTLSDDILRYRWDGRVAVAGHNPYRLAPESSELSELRDEVWQRMPHKEVPTVYPPLALGVFSIASLLPAPALAIKLLLTAADLLTCALLLRLALALGVPAGRTLWYAWSPLATIEVAGMGHVDALVALAIVATVALLLRGRPATAAAAAAAGVLAKLVPAVALPMWSRQSGKPWRFLALASALILAAIGPFLLALGGPPPGLVTYGVSWEFNGPLYEPVWRLFDVIGLDHRIKDGLDTLKAWTGRHDELNHVYPLVYPQLLAKAALLALLAIFVAASLRATAPLAGSGRLLAGVLLCSATLYPWYLLWILPLAALARHRAWLALAGSIQLSYLPQLAGVPLFPWLFALIWLPFFFLLLVERWSSTA